MVSKRGGWLLASVLAWAWGCSGRPPVDAPPSIELQYETGVGWCPDCESYVAMAERAHAVVRVLNPEALPPFAVTSDYPSVVEFTQDESDPAWIDAVSREIVPPELGTANMVFTDTSTGALFHRRLFDVHEVARVELEDPAMTTRYMIMTGGRGFVSFDLLDARDQPLQGYGGVDYAAAGGLAAGEITLVSALEETLTTSLSGSSERVTIEANAPGSGSVAVTAPSGATFSLPVQVVDASAVATVMIEGGEYSAGPPISIVAQTFASDGEQIHSPECVWTVATATGMVSTSSYRDTVTLTAETDASAVVTCAVGAANASATINFVRY